RSRGDDRRRAHPAGSRAVAGRRLGRGLRPHRQGAGERHPAEARHLLREHLMAITVLEVQRVAVIGAGTMGTGIAQVAARAGYRTSLYDAAEGAARRSLDRIGEALSRAVERGKCTAAERDEALARLSTAADLESAAG